MSPPAPIAHLTPPAGGTTRDMLYSLDGWQIIEQAENGSALAKRQFISGGFINEPVAMGIDPNGDGISITRRI